MIQITDAKLDTWLSDAKKATQGEFKAWPPGDDDNEECASVNNCPDSQMRMPQLLLAGGLDTGGDCLTVLTFEDAKHIANACPKNFIALIEELRARRFKDRPMEEYEEIARISGEYQE